MSHSRRPAAAGAAGPSAGPSDSSAPDISGREKPDRGETPAGELHFIEPDGSNREEIRQLGYRFVDLLVDSASQAGNRPPLDRDPGPAVGPYHPSETGRSIDSLLDEIREMLNRGMNPAHPGYLGHMDSIASTVGIFSDALVSALNNNMLAWEMSPVFTEMERRVMSWACSLFGLDQGPGDDSAAEISRRGMGPIGQMVSGGTLANITALLVARNARGGDEVAGLGLAASERRLVFLASENAHFSFQKAANILGLGREAWIRIPADERGRVRVELMEEEIRRVRDEGKQPFCLVGVAGTTVTGSLDPLEEIGALARREGLWFHVDAAYGGAIALSENLRPRLRGIEAADSITFNPQKWLFVPKTCASILFRNGEEVSRHLREPFVYGTSNRALSGGSTRVNLGEWTLQGTRRVDVLKLYLTLEHLGQERLARMIETNCRAAARLASAIASHPDLELVSEPDLNIVCFRHRGSPNRPEWVEDQSPLDRLNARIQERVERIGHAWLSLPRYRKQSILRAVILHPRCDDALLDRMLAEVRQIGEELIRTDG